MSITDQNQAKTLRGDDAKTLRERTFRETKPSPKTTELWLTIIGVVALVVIYNTSSDASLNLFRVCLLGTAIAAAYIVSRGFAKAGSHDDDDQVTRNGRQY